MSVSEGCCCPCSFPSVGGQPLSGHIYACGGEVFFHRQDEGQDDGKHIPGVPEHSFLDSDFLHPDICADGNILQLDCRCGLGPPAPCNLHICMVLCPASETSRSGHQLVVKEEERGYVPSGETA